MTNNFYDILKKSINLDIYSAVFTHNKEAFYSNLSIGTSHLPKKGKVIRLISFSKYFFYSLLGLMKFRQPPKEQCMFFVSTKNEKDSIYPVYEQIKSKSIIVGSRQFSNYNAPYYYPLALGYILSLFYIPVLIIKYLKGEEWQKEAFNYYLDQYLLAYGLYIVSVKWLAYIKPKTIILANDVITCNNILKLAAKIDNIPTIFFQHSSISQYVPPLNFQYAFLDGYDAMYKYKNSKESTGDIYLVGMSKFDKYFNYINKNKTISSIGICGNQIDSIDKIEEVCASLKKNLPDLTIILRPHPDDPKKKNYEELAQKYKLIYSNPKTEFSFDCIKKTDLIIAGDSGILLEAALMDVVPISYNFAQINIDWYSFKKNKIVEYFAETDPLCDYIKTIRNNKPHVRIRAKQYCATIGTNYDGSSAVLAAHLIQKLIIENVSLNDWNQVVNVNDRFRVYELSS